LARRRPTRADGKLSAPKSLGLRSSHYADVDHGRPKEPKKTMKSHILIACNEISWLVRSISQMRYLRFEKLIEYRMCRPERTARARRPKSRVAGPVNPPAKCRRREEDSALIIRTQASEALSGLGRLVGERTGALLRTSASSVGPSERRQVSRRCSLRSTQPERHWTETATRGICGVQYRRDARGALGGVTDRNIS
jgi:hypothetical protein